MDFLAKYGPWALITGASEGTGRAFALDLAKRGLHCILVSRRAEPLEELAEQVRAEGVECVTASVDLAATDAAAQVAAAVGDREVGLFIANAGADDNSARFLNNGVENWDRLVNLNVVTTMRNCHQFAGPMRERRRGGIILVNSSACYGGIAGISIYCGVKAFDLAFGEALWAELRHDGVDVLNLVLVQTDTPAYRRILKERGESIPENMAQPADVAAVGLERLPHGPVHNWGQDEAATGYAVNSPADRRERIVAIEAMMQAQNAHT